METINYLEVEIGTVHSSISGKSVVDNIESNNTENTETNNQSTSLPYAPSAENKGSETSAQCLGQANDFGTDKSTAGTLNNLKATMLFHYSKGFVCFIALLLTTYATLINKDPIIGGTVSPKPIFPLDSIVQEWPNGNLVDVQSKAPVSELSLIFFYAPWCAESLFARKLYNSLAKMYSKEIYFAAVNCWQPNSACRAIYSNVYKWPVLMVYLPNGLFVQYNGSWNYDSLTKFIDTLLTPIVRIHNMNELMHLRIANDAVILGLFNSSDSKEYQIYVHAALKWLETESFQNTKFALYVGKDSLFLEPTKVNPPVIKIFTHNDTTIYKSSNWVSKKIVSFVKQNVAGSNIWINLSNIKSYTMSKYLQKGPVMIMFSPRMSKPSKYYFIMKQIAYLYNNKGKEVNNTLLASLSNLIENEHSANLRKIVQFCELSRKEYKQSSKASIFVDAIWDDALFSLDLQTANISKLVPNILNIQNDRKRQNCKGEFYVPNQNRIDDRSPSELLKSYMMKQCLHLEKVSTKLMGEASTVPISVAQFAVGEHFPHNRTLTFLMLDSAVHSNYMKNFIGEIAVNEQSSQTPLLVIIDNKEESLYMKRGPITSTSVLEFISDFSQGKLVRHLRSSKKVENLTSISSKQVKIKEINSQQFFKVIQRKNVTSIVLFYSPQCSLCYVMSQTLLQVTQIITLKNVQFYRIDASANDVCWEYTMDKLPTLIIFPQNRSDETVVFPSTLKIDVKNIFSFILSKLKPEQQLKSLMNACILTKLSVAFQSCVHLVRGMISNEISRFLRQWNLPFSNQTLLLTRLSLLNEVYLELLRAKKGSDLEFILKDILNYRNDVYAYIS